LFNIGYWGLDQIIDIIKIIQK